MTIIAGHQFNGVKKPGLTKDELYILATKEMLISSQLQLKGYLDELIDHKVVLYKEENDGKIHLYIGYPKTIVQKVLLNN